jgi:hypothetical protein
MPTATVIGAALTFGVDADEQSLTTQSVSVVRRHDKKEARDKQGFVVAVAYYNQTNEISIEGLGGFSTAPGTVITLSGAFSVATVGKVIVDEVTEEHANEEFIKTSIKATAYEGIPTS